MGTHLVDPNDPRNAALLELLKAQEAQSGTALNGLFRLDVPPAVALLPPGQGGGGGGGAVAYRVHGMRLEFLARRWRSGPYRDPSKSVIQAARQVRCWAAGLETGWDARQQGQ
jgi:coiled-coil and C2 domain-containing protein 2A